MSNTIQRRAPLDALMRAVAHDAKVQARFTRFIADEHSGPYACLTWRGGRSHDGYGLFSLHGHKVYAHRFAYILAGEPNGPLTPDLDLDHVCDAGREGCISAWHMQPTTQRVNILRGYSPSARNARKERCPRCNEPYATRPDTNWRRCLNCASAYKAAYYRARADGCSPEIARRAGREALVERGRKCGRYPRIATLRTAWLDNKFAGQITWAK
jgi:hypothetical protein